MSDLISRKETYNELIESIDWLRERDYELYCVIGDSIRVCLDEQPTAYDIDKVVTELEQKKTKLLSYARDYEKIGNFEQAEIYSQIASEYTTAIEIVKRGGENE